MFICDAQQLIQTILFLFHFQISYIFYILQCFYFYICSLSLSIIFTLVADFIYFTIIAYQQINSKMDIQNTLNFCNQYLMFKLLTQIQSPHPNSTLASNPNKIIAKKKTNRSQKIQNPNKKPNNELEYKGAKYETSTGEKVKGKKKKFEGVSLKKQSDKYAVNEGESQTKDEGYVPIENLLNMLTCKTDKKVQYSTNDYSSFGRVGITPNSQIPYQKPANYYENYSFFSNPQSTWNYQPKQYYQSSQPPNSFLNMFFPNSMAEPVLQPSRSDYLYQSPSRFPSKPVTQFHVPVSRSRMNSNLQYSQSCSNLSMHSNNQNKSFNADTKSRSKSRKKRNGQREFYIPVSINASDKINEGKKVQQRQISRCASTNKMIAKLEREIQERKQLQKSQISDTRFETKNKQTTTLGRQLDDYSMIQLDNGVRESLSFVSDINIPNIAPQPINIQLNR